MNLDDNAVERKNLAFDNNEPFALKPLKNFGEGAIFTPPIHSGINGVPVAEFFWGSPPVAAILRDVGDSIEKREIMQREVSPSVRKAIGNAFILFFGYGHGVNMTHDHNSSNSVNRP